MCEAKKLTHLSEKVQLHLLQTRKQQKKPTQKSEANIAPVWVRQVRICASDFFFALLFTYDVFLLAAARTLQGVRGRSNGEAGVTGHKQHGGVYSQEASKTWGRRHASWIKSVDFEMLLRPFPT